MPQADFECPPGMNGTIKVRPIDPTSPGTTPYIIEIHDPFDVLVEWEIHGATAPFLGGQWKVRLFIDPADGTATTKGPLGSAALVAVGAPPVPPLPPPAPAHQRKYSNLFKFTGGTVTEGVYHITAVVTYDNGGVPLEMAGFAEIPFIEFYAA